MGAYYTKEDITEYIAKNTIIPYLFDAARQKCAIAFRPESPLWGLLRDDPDRYIYPAVRQGVVDEQGQIIPLPDEIAAGLDDVSKRGGWNRPAEAPYALPTETWREHVARRNRCLELRKKLAAGEVHEINDLITLNLDIRQFAQDVIENCEGPELLLAFYHAIAGRTPEKPGEKHEPGISVLDPTCGSGAFLFAALNILEPLYDACLERMKAFLDELERLGGKADSKRYGEFRKILPRFQGRRSRRYVILKSIILGNLYGVDIMEEAVEICKLRLFLKLVAQLERAEQIEPLPDIDFNIRAGNTLVGYTSIEAVRESHRSRYPGFPLTDVEKLAVQAKAFGEHYALFCQRQIDAARDAQRAADIAAAKQGLRSLQRELADQLDRYLAGDYGIDADKKKNADDYLKWRQSHQPFHWFVEFYGIMAKGGFDVIIGNPPWIEYARVRNEYTINNYRTEPCGNLHAVCTERGLGIRSPFGCMSFIVQLPMVSSSRMVTVRRVLRESSAVLHVIPFGDRPGKLFDGLEHSRATIWLSSAHGRLSGQNTRLATSRYQRWPTQARSLLFHALEFACMESPGDIPLHVEQFPKYANNASITIFRKIKERADHALAELISNRQTSDFVFYQEATEYWVKATVGLPYYAKNGIVGAPAHGRYLYQANEDDACWTCALMHSSLFFMYFVAHSDCFHLSDGLVRSFLVPKSLIGDERLVQLGAGLMDALRSGAERKAIQTRTGDKIAYDEYYGWKAKSTIDRIDQLLGKHYAFTEAELDFVMNYDIKFRMGQDEGEATE
jgi:methylase of polypeptide subunit release factors